MSHNRPYLPSRGSRDQGGQNGHYPPSHYRQVMYCDNTGYINYHQNWTDNEVDYTHFGSENWQLKYTSQLQQQTKWYATQPQYSKSWNLPAHSDYSSSRGGTYRNKNQYSHRTNPPKRIKLEVTNREDSTYRGTSNQYPRNQARETFDHTHFRTLLQQVKTVEPYHRSGQIQDVLRLKNDEVNSANLESNNLNQVVLSASSNSASNVNDLANNQSIQKQSEKQHEMLHRKNLPKSIVTASLLDGYNKDLFANNGSGDYTVSSCSNISSSIATAEYQKRSEGLLKSHSYVEEKIRDNVPAEQSISSLLSNSGGEKNKSSINNDIGIISHNDSDSNSLPLCDDDNRINSPVAASSSPYSIYEGSDNETDLDLCAKGVFSEDSTGEIMNSPPAIVATTDIDLCARGVFSEDSTGDIMSPPPAIVATSADVNTMLEGSVENSDTDESEESTDDEESEESKDDEESEESKDDEESDLSEDEFIHHSKKIISSDTDENEESKDDEESDLSEDEMIPNSGKESSSSCKRKDQEDKLFTSESKKVRIILENEKDVEIIVISSDEEEQNEVDTLPSTLLNSSTLNVERKIENNKSTFSKAMISNLSTSNHHKLISVNSTERVEDKKSLEKKSLISKTAEKKKQVTSLSVKKRAPVRDNKPLPTLPIQQEGKQRHIISSRKLVVSLKRLSPHEILKFPVSKNIVDKSTVLYQKDVLNQIKYFISYIENLSTNNIKVSLTTHLDDPKDLYNQQLCCSDNSKSTLVEIKYLQSNKHSKITYKTLSNPEFDIKKLYKSFLNFRKNLNKDLKYFKIFTNIELSIDNFRNNGVKVHYENDQYRMSVKEDHELHKKFIKCLTLYNLAELLFECIEKRKQKNFNTDLIKKYHLALINEKILKIHNTKNANGKQVQVAKFHLDFIRETALSDSAKELRHYMTNLLCCQPRTSMYFTLTDPFGKDTNLDPMPIIDIELADVLASKDQAKLLMVKDNLKKIVGHVLEKIENNIFGFSKQFLEGTDLPGNLKKFRYQMKTLCDHRKMDFKKFCRDYKISIDDFCNDYPMHRLPNENGKELFKEFFNILSFENIEKHVCLNKDISKINDEAVLNAVLKEVYAGLKSGKLGTEISASIKRVISTNRIIKTPYKYQQPKINIQFHENVISTYQAKLPKYGIICCVTKCLSLTNAIVKQLSDKLNYKEDKESLFITNKALLEMTNDVLNALSDKSTHLLVVQWNDSMDTNTRVLDVLINKIENERSANKTSMKSVIVIIHEKHYRSEMNRRFKSTIRDDEHSFELSEDSRMKLLQAENISLQHRRLSFIKSDLILDKHVPILLESTQVLSQLFTGKLVIGKDIMKPNGYKESLFKTQIKQCIIVNPLIFHEKIEDVFIIRNIDRKDLEKYLPSQQKILSPNDVPASMRINARFILLGFNVPPSFFDGYAEKNLKHSVHLLRYESGSFVWEKTSGNNKDLLRNRLDNIDNVLKTQKNEDVVTEGPKTIIICGESGSGKSVGFYNLAREIKNLYKTECIDAFWPIQINLDSARLSKYTKKDLNIATEKDFVAKFLCNYLELNEVQSKMLTMIFQNQLKIKLALFFDNFEDLPPLQRKFVIQLLQELQVSYCEKIYVTSTLNTRSELEDALAVFAYTLEFSEVEKIQLLQSFWSKSFGEDEYINEAGHFIDYHSKAGANDDDLTTTPLQLKMLAAMYKPGDEDFTCIESQDELYKRYIEHKGVKDEESACFYSLRKILTEDQLKAKNLHDKHPKKGFILPDDLQHRTFYEYFSAKWFSKSNPHRKDCQLISLLDIANLSDISLIFLKTYLAEVRTNDMIKIVGDFAANGHLNHLKMMLTHCKDKLSLSNIIQSENPNARETVRFILDHYNDTKDDIMLHGEFKKKKYADANVVKYVNRREKPKKETPLEVAARMKKISIACELLLKGANIEKIDKNFIFNVAQYIANEMCKTDSKWLHPIAEKLFKLRPDGVAHLDKMKKYPRLLSYFYTHGRVELIDLLLKNDCQRYNILVTKVDNKSPLDLVNESCVLSDDERLDMTKYIVSNVGDDLERRNKYYLADVLKAAAGFNHERTFEYFVGKYPNKHMGFLESAMKSNKLNLIRFLMRKTDRMMYPGENTALHKAVSLGVSPSTIKFLVNRGGIDNKNKFGETPLCIAFKEGQDFELIEYLIKRDAHLFTKDELGLYPWCHAILEDSKYSSDEQINIMKYLQNKVKLNAPETEQKISFESDQKRKDVAKKLKFFKKPQDFVSTNLELYIALKSNNQSWMKFLILHGANVNKESEGRMPLHIAIEFKRYKLAKMMLDHGAMYNVEDKSNRTPLQLLENSGDESKESLEIKQLLKTAKKLFGGNEKYSEVPRHLINCRDKYGRTLLHAIAKNGDKAAIKDIIKLSKNYCIDNKDFPSIDVNATDLEGQTPLNLVKKDSVDVAKELLANGAIFEPANTSLLKSAKKLIQAVKDKDLGKVKELVKNECLVNARDESGKSCLHYVAIFDCIEIMKVILTVKVLDIDATDLNMQTPLHYAVEKDNIACVVLLLKAGASYDVKNKRGNRPFDIVDKTNESLNLLRKIDEMFLDIKSDEPRILNNDNPDALTEYLSEINRVWHVSKDIVVNVNDNKKNTLLHIATRYDFSSVVENLLKQGAFHNAKNKKKISPESMAISTKQLFRNVQAFTKSSVSSWLKFDPELVVNLRSNNGNTLLHYYADKGKKEEVKWLIENGADVKATNNRGSKIKCDKKKYPDIFELLLEN